MSRGGGSTSPTRRSASSTSSTSTPRRVPSAVAGGSSISADEQLWPDGKTVDDDGMLWIAVGRAGAVHRYRADGTLDGVVELPTSNPTSVAFGGDDGGDLYITTSWVDSERRADEPLAGAIFRCRPGVTGQPSPRCTELPQTSRERRHPMIERMVLFGASGDLTSRLLLPAVAQLAEAELLPPALTIVGSDLTDWSTDDFREHIAGKLEEHATVTPATRDSVVGMLSFEPADVTQPEDVRRVIGDGPSRHAGLPRAAAEPAD